MIYAPFHREVLLHLLPDSKSLFSAAVLPGNLALVQGLPVTFVNRGIVLAVVRCFRQPVIVDQLIQDAEIRIFAHGMFFDIILIKIDQCVMAVTIPVCDFSPHSADQLPMGIAQLRITIQGFLGVFCCFVLMFAGQMVLHICQQLVGSSVLRLLLRLSEQEFPGRFHVCRVQKTHIPEHILDALHPGVVRNSEELIDCHAKICRKIRKQPNIRGCGSPFPFADCLRCNSEMLRHCLLGDSTAQPQLLDLISDIHSVFSYSKYFGPVGTILRYFPGKHNGRDFEESKPLVYPPENLYLLQLQRDPAGNKKALPLPFR